MKKFLHVGCGPKTKERTTRAFNTPEWDEVRFDIDQAAKPDIVGTMTDMLAVQTGSMDGLYSSHNIEHLHPHEVEVAIKEFYRVLSDDGFVMITCPDLQSVCELVAQDKLLETAYQSPAGPITPLDMLYGHRPAMAQGNLYMAHKCGFTQKVLTGLFRQHGFRSVAGARRVAPHFDLFCLASKPELPESELLALAKQHFP